MSDAQLPSCRKQPWLLTVLVSLGLGVLGACLGFVAGFAFALALTRNSGAAIAGGGDGVDALIALCFMAGLVGAVTGGLIGAWLGVRSVGR
jgi:hypothetical protein